MRFAGLLIFLASVAASPLTADDKPNIIVIFTDDHGWADLGVHRIREDIRMPHIDALANGGALITNGYVTAPQCVPSRAGLLTGKYQPRFGVESNGNDLRGFNAEPTIAERLKAAGYATGMAGKWHLGPVNEITKHGFDCVYATQGRAWANMNLDGDMIKGQAIDDAPYHLDAASDAATAFIRRYREKPFFFYLAYRAPHVPLDAPPRYLQRFQGDMPERRRKALAMMSAIDDGVGRIMTTLRELELEENTLIFFISDNGAPLKIHKRDALGGGPGWDGSLNDPLNGEKGMLTEGGIRVPFVVYWKGKLKPQVYDHPVISLDVAATACNLAGLPNDPGFDGVDLMPFLSGEQTAVPHDELYWRWIAQAAIREGKWKLLLGGTREYLYDVVSDREEKNNVAKEHPEIADRLRSKLTKWAGELDPPGLATKPMSSTWENYYDYYLEGKPAPADGSRAAIDKSYQGWVVRNATANMTRDGLQIKPTTKRPFLAFNGLKVDGPATARLQVKCESTGVGAIAWREFGQEDFKPDQSAKFEIREAGDWQPARIELRPQRRIIHVRVILPETETVIRRIDLLGNEKSGAQWSFSQTAE